MNHSRQGFIVHKLLKPESAAREQEFSPPVQHLVFFQGSSLKSKNCSETTSGIVCSNINTGIIEYS